MDYFLYALVFVTLQLSPSSASNVTFLCLDDPETQWLPYNSSCSSGYSDVSFLHAESPRWDPDTDTFFWVDVINQNVYSLNFTNWESRMRHTEIGEINVVNPIKDSNRVLLAVNSSLYILDWDIPGERGLRILALTDQGLPENVLNEGKPDAYGRLWIGSKGPQKSRDVTPDLAALYSVEGPLYQPQVQWKPVSISNGLVWSLNNSLLYYIDSADRTVDVFDFDLDVGRISNRRTIIDLGDYDFPDEAIPDGITIDKDGCLWVAINFAGYVAKVDPDAKNITQTIQLPVTSVTSPAWGGPNFETLFVASSQLDLSSLELQEQPLAGSVFVFNDLGTTGVPEYKFNFPNADTY